MKANDYEDRHKISLADRLYVSYLQCLEQDIHQVSHRVLVPVCRIPEDFAQVYATERKQTKCNVEPLNLLQHGKNATVGEQRRRRGGESVERFKKILAVFTHDDYATHNVLPGVSA